MQFPNRVLDDVAFKLCYPLLVAVLVFISLGAVPTLSQDLSSSQQSTAVRFATSSVKPWGIRNATGNQGLLVAVIDELERMTGVSISNELQPYPRVVHSIHSGFVDFAFLFDSPATEIAAIRIGHLIDSQMIVVGRAGSTKLNSLDELSGKSVGFIRGSKYGPAFDDATHFKRVPVSTMEQGLAMLMRNRMDVMAGTDQALYWSMRNMNVGAKRLTKLYVLNGASGSLYVSKSSDHKDLVPVFREALSTLKKNGTIDRIFHSDYQWANSN